MKTGWVEEKQIKHSKKQGTDKGGDMKMSMAEGQKEPSKEQGFMSERSGNSNCWVKFGQEYKIHEKHTGSLDLMPRAGRLARV